jgi:tRNA pseudouridine55 synthase
VSSLPEDFVLPVDKPEGPSSHDVVRVARKALRAKRVGHTGTLDPFASGLLLLCVGKATRLAEYLSGMDKSYHAVARLGVRTDTLDLEGQVVDESGGWEDLTTDRVANALAAFLGEIEQVPPAYSAKKVAGERAYRRAREGREVELEPCPVTVRSIELISLDLPSVAFHVVCSSGTYVRALARDIGEALGSGAHLTGLRRLAIGDWRIENAVSLDEMGDASALARRAVPPLAAVGHLPQVEVDEEGARRLSLGQPVSLAETPVLETPVAVAHAGVLLAIGEASEGLLRPRKVFAA